MKASIVDLRYRMRDILKALDRNERVTILYHGKIKGIITSLTGEGSSSITDHPFFGMNSKEAITVEEQMGKIRGGRFDDL
ncbi:MAG TPA: type II toxin-antitoxin system Phd/YefM family antitoxin [Spirochaetota bacterium]|nr:type II toxin-antitoxin system Phd/YefM family antitoxin [Spirochaetota bacterium]